MSRGSGVKRWAQDMSMPLPSIINSTEAVRNPPIDHQQQYYMQPSAGLSKYPLYLKL